MRYDYAGPYKTQAKAESVLESMFAEGDCREGEFPEIENRSGRTASWSKWTPQFVISLGDEPFR